MAAVTSKHEDILFVSVETSGDADISVLSRVQMALSDATARAQSELDDALQLSGRSMREIRQFAEDNPSFRRPSARIPRTGQFACPAANFCLHIGNCMARNNY